MYKDRTLKNSVVPVRLMKKDKSQIYWLFSSVHSVFSCHVCVYKDYAIS